MTTPSQRRPSPVVIHGAVAIAALVPASLVVAIAGLAEGADAALAVAAGAGASAAPFFAPAAQRRWLFAGLGAVLLAWMVGQVVAAMKVRIPVYELPESGAESGSGTAMDRTGSA